MFTLVLRVVGKMLAERGLDVSYETIRRWSLKFGNVVASNLRPTRPRSGDHWHLDEILIVIFSVIILRHLRHRDITITEKETFKTYLENIGREGRRGIVALVLPVIGPRP